jgi:hypothetical protein
LHQVGDLFELNIKRRCQNVKCKTPVPKGFKGILKRSVGQWTVGCKTEQKVLILSLGAKIFILI